MATLSRRGHHSEEVKFGGVKTMQCHRDGKGRLKNPSSTSRPCLAKRRESSDQPSRGLRLPEQILTTPSRLQVGGAFQA